MNSIWRRLLEAVHPEGIPWPGSVLYSALTRSSIFQRHYELVADDIASRCPAGRVLDVGTGPGWLLLKLRARCAGLQLVGLDISSAMVSKARENISRAGGAGAIKVARGSANDLPFADASFDLVTSTGSLHHWADPVAGLNEVYRVLKPGSAGLIYDLVMRMPSAVRRDVVRRFGKARMALLILHSFEEPFYESADMEALAAESAFGEGRVRYVGALCCLVLEKPPPRDLPSRVGIRPRT